MKKRIALVLAAVVLLALFNGCGGTDEPTQKPVDVSAGESPAAPETEEPARETDEPDKEAYFPLAETAVLSYWFSYPPIFGDYAEGPQDYLVYTEAEKRLNVEIEWMTANFMAATEQFNIMVASDDYTDLISGMQNYMTTSLDQAVEDEIIVDLTDYMDEYAPDYAAARRQNDITAKTSTTDNGRLAQFYYLQTEEGAVPDKGLLIRMDWLEESGLGSPKTYNDYYEYLKYTSSTYGAGLGLPSEGAFNEALFSAGFETYTIMGNNTQNGLFQIDGEVHFGPVEEGYRDYLQLLNDWYNEGLIMADFVSEPESATSGYPQEDSISSGKTSLFCGTSKNLAYYEGLLGGPVLDAVPNPIKEEGQELHFRELGNAAYQPAVAISTQCEDLELAMRFLNWFFTDEGYVLTNYGVEGLTFNYEGGEVVFTDLITDNPDGMSLNIALTLYTGGTAGVPMLFDNTKFRNVYSEKQYNAGFVWNENNNGAWGMASVTLTAEESAQISSAYGDIKTYVLENTVKFIIGSRSLGDWDDYVATIEGQGLAEVLEVYTAAVGRYNAR